MSAVQGLLALAMLSLMIGKTSAVEDLSTSLSDGCLPDIKDPEAYKFEHPICARLSAYYRAKETNETLQQNRCWVVSGRPMSVTLYWDRDPSRAAAALFAVLLRHVMGFQRVNLAPSSGHLLQVQPDVLGIRFAAPLDYEDQRALENLDQEIVSKVSDVPSEYRLQAWLTPAARDRIACRFTNWSFYSNLTALSYCGFIDDLPDSYLRDVSMAAIEVFGVGDDCKPSMQRLLQNAKAAAIPARAVFINRSYFKHMLLTSKYSFLFLDVNIWETEPSMSLVEPPCSKIQSHFNFTQCQLDQSIAMELVDSRIKVYFEDVFKLVQGFKPTFESLTTILEKESNGVNVEEAACEWTESRKSYYPDMYPKDILRATNIADSGDLQDPLKTYVVTFSCGGMNYRDSYDKTTLFIGTKIYREKRAWSISFFNIFVYCSDPKHIGRSLDSLMQGPIGPQVLGVVSTTEKGAEAASRAAAVHHVPLLLTATVADQGALGASTWLAAGRLRHVTRALHCFFSKSGCTRMAVLSQPTTFAQRFFVELQDKAEFFIRNFELPLNLTEELAEVVLQELQATKTRVVLVNINSGVAAAILSTAVKLNMSYTDGFIWVVRERLSGLEYGTTHFTVSFEDILVNRFAPIDDTVANALLTLERGFDNVLQRHPYMLNDLHNDQVIRALDDSLTETPVTGLNGEQLHYKDRAIEEVYVYVDKWEGDMDTPQRVATWRVNATSGAVRNKDGSPPTLDFDFNVIHVPDLSSFDSGVRSNADGGSVGTNGGKLYVTSNTPANASNTTIIVRQWVQSISKIETSKNDLSESDILKFFKLN
ncbi:hypothetical protein PYW08_011896 [Mythimna loreyi]|uniref:Uncharacterized protein n=1 Tax=Mythimna loreyi TaxID=667449 RepID=A0ACC2QPR4_9NEOP|nr:hypothetical protein PYW08_011896 [Mythimna loreyi]